MKKEKYESPEVVNLVLYPALGQDCPGGMVYDCMPGGGDMSGCSMGPCDDCSNGYEAGGNCVGPGTGAGLICDSSDSSAG